MVKKEIAVRALTTLVDNLGPFINGLDPDEIGELYMKSLKMIING